MTRSTPFCRADLTTRNVYRLEIATSRKYYSLRQGVKKDTRAITLFGGFYFDWAQHKYFDPSVALRTGSAQYRLGKVRVNSSVRPNNRMCLRNSGQSASTSQRQTRVNFTLIRTTRVIFGCFYSCINNDGKTNTCVYSGPN